MINSNAAETSLFEEDEEGTEVIPRFLPAPMEQIEPVKSDTCHREQQMMIKQKQWQQPQQRAEQQKQQQQQIAKPNDCSVQKIKQSSLEFGGNITGNDCSKGASTKKNDSSCLSSIKTNLFINTPMTQQSSSASISTTVTNTTTNTTATLIERTSTLLHRLSCMGIIPNQVKETGGMDGTNVKDDSESEEQQSIHHNKEPHECFLSLIYNMIEVACAHQHNYDESIPLDKRNSDTDDINRHAYESGTKLHGLLSILEQILEEVSRSNQQMNYWKNQYHELLLSSNNRQQNGDSNFTFTNHAQNNPRHEIMQSSQMMSILQQENENLRRQLMEVDPSQLMEIQNQLTGKHMECQRLQEMLQLLEQERNHLRNLCEGKNSTNVRFERDMLTLQTENETVTNENHHLHTEVLRLRQSLNEAENYLKLTEESLRASTAARNEMITKWNVALKERTILENELGQSSRESSVIKQQIIYSREEKQRLSQKIESLETNAQNAITGLATLTREKKKLSMELDVMKQSWNKIQEENHRLGHDLNSSRMNSDLKSQKTFELEQIAVKTQYDAEAFRNMASELGMERDAVRAMLEEERSKIQKFENIIASTETREFAASEQIRKLVREKALLVTKLNEANARNVKTALHSKDQSGFLSAKYRSPLSSKTNESMTPHLKGNMKIRQSEFTGLSSFKGRLNGQVKAIKHPCDEKDRINSEAVFKPLLTVKDQPSFSFTPQKSPLSSNSMTSDTMSTDSVHKFKQVNLTATMSTSTTIEKTNVSDIRFTTGDKENRDIIHNSCNQIQSQIENKCETHSPPRTATLLDYLSQEDVSTIT